MHSTQRKAPTQLDNRAILRQSSNNHNHEDTNRTSTIAGAIQRASLDPSTLTGHDAHHLQRTIGNAQLTQLLTNHNTGREPVQRTPTQINFERSIQRMSEHVDSLVAQGERMKGVNRERQHGRQHSSGASTQLMRQRSAQHVETPSTGDNLKDDTIQRVSITLAAPIGQSLMSSEANVVEFWTTDELVEQGGDATYQGDDLEGIYGNILHLVGQFHDETGQGYFEGTDLVRLNYRSPFGLLSMRHYIHEWEALYNTTYPAEYAPTSSTESEQLEKAKKQKAALSTLKNQVDTIFGKYGITYENTAEKKTGLVDLRGKVPKKIVHSEEDAKESATTMSSGVSATASDGSSLVESSETKDQVNVGKSDPIYMTVMSLSNLEKTGGKLSWRAKLHEPSDKKKDKENEKNSSKKDKDKRSTYSRILSSLHTLHSLDESNSGHDTYVIHELRILKNLINNWFSSSWFRQRSNAQTDATSTQHTRTTALVNLETQVDAAIEKWNEVRGR